MMCAYKGNLAICGGSIPQIHESMIQATSGLMSNLELAF